MSYEGTPRQQQPQEAYEAFRGRFNAMMNICRILNSPLQAFSRRPGTCGTQYFGLLAAISIFALPVFCGFVQHPSQSRQAVEQGKGTFWGSESFQSQLQPAKHVRPPAHHQDGVLGFVGLYLLMLLCHRTKYAEMTPAERGAIHSRFGGSSLFAKRGVVKSEQAARLVIEPLFWGGLGWALRHFDMAYALGTYFMAGAVALFMEAFAERLIEQARKRAIQDAQLEVSYMAEQHRETQMGR